ncbi:MAG: efflux RND transporter periplasmic adaptor subunit [Alphaproteobacteria bacterium]|nr:efflux RND transporter periplasmic adaptor subunit [Alphaproteobacteria bacterium]
MKMKWIIGGLIAAGLAAGGYFYRTAEKGLTLRDFEMVRVERGKITQQVTASGTIQPINKISVGTQVSGIVENILVDYNDEVREGQLLAKLDTSVLVENKNDADARLKLAEQKQKIAKLNYERTEKLYKDKLISKVSLEDAEIAYATAEAETLSAQAEFNKAKRNYDYASIISPVSGTVISKEVEQGQTVAASLQTPTLFTIAEDLSKMQIEASIAEADIGRIVPNMSATFSVDAYINDTFEGKVRQIRLSPTSDQNVVMYTVVIEVDNSSRKLLPGMTAFVTIKIREKDDALRLPTATLQYKPNAQVRRFIDKKAVEVGPRQSIVYRFAGGRIVPTIFERGISDVSHVEVKEGLNEGDAVISEYLPKAKGRP